MTRANSVRGEAKLTVGCHQLVVAIEFARLAAFSAASGLHDIGQCFNALIALSPAHAEAALEAFVSEGDIEGAKASLDTVDQEEWAAAFSHAVGAWIDRNRAAREKTSPKRKAPARSPT
tara:strand:+ start:24696 stop:25052 length:357 start_codon:yes stop_codon:yes gene_type:complete